MGRSSKRNQKSNILAAIDCNQNRDRSKAKCVFLYNLLSALSSHLTRAYCATKPAVNGTRGQPWESGGGGVNRTVTMG